MTAPSVAATAREKAVSELLRATAAAGAASRWLAEADDEELTLQAAKIADELVGLVEKVRG